MDLQQLLLSQFDQSRRARLLFRAGRVLRVNRSLAALLGVEAETLVDRALEELVAPLPLSAGQRVIRLRTPGGLKPCSCRVQLDDEDEAGLLLFDSAGGLGNEAMAERLASILEITQ